MKKRIMCILLCLSIVCAFSGCSGEQREVSCEEVTAAYEAAGYEVFHKHPAEGYAYSCYIEVENEADERIFFHFFDTEQEAQSYANERQYNALIWVFSVIYGDPTWVHTTSYKNIEIEYADKSLYEIFDKLIN